MKDMLKILENVHEELTDAYNSGFINRAWLDTLLADIYSIMEIIKHSDDVDESI